MITLKQAKALRPGDMLHHVEVKNADKTPMRLKVNGKVKTWKRDVDRLRVPLKYGLYEHGYLTNGTDEGGRFSFNLGLHQVNLGDGR